MICYFCVQQTVCPIRVCWKSITAAKNVLKTIITHYKVVTSDDSPKSLPKHAYALFLYDHAYALFLYDYNIAAIGFCCILFYIFTSVLHMTR